MPLMRYQIVRVTGGGAVAFEHTEGRTLDRLITASAPPDRAQVTRWARQLAHALESLHEHNLVHGSIAPDRVIIDDKGDACLAAGGITAARPGRVEECAADVRDLAHTLRRVLGGDPQPIRGLSVQMNLALLTPGGPSGTAERRRARRAPLTRIAVAAAVVAVAFLAWLWMQPAPKLRPPEGEESSNQPGIASELLAIDRQIKSVAADRARDRWLKLLAEKPAMLYDQLRAEIELAEAEGGRAELFFNDGRFAEALDAWEGAAATLRRLLAAHRAARSEVERVSAAWQAALAAAPQRWLGDDQVNAWCAEAHETADTAAVARHEGRFDDALLSYELAADMLIQAITLQGEGVSGLLADAEQARDQGRRRKARSAVDAVLELDPENPEGLRLEESVESLAPRHRDVLVNSLSQTLVFIERGRLLMGSPPTEPFRKGDEVQHEVLLSRGFWMGRIEVTRGQFAAFVTATQHRTDAEVSGWSHGVERDGRWRRLDGLSWRDPGFVQGDNHPVVCVSHRDAEAFCRWMSATEGRTYRLPTEAEWEYACRAGSAGTYAWGDDPFVTTPLANAADVAWNSRMPESIGFPWFDGYVHTGPVAGFPANAWGLFDMYGNVSEWCLDVYREYEPHQVLDPVATSNAERAPRVLRGGSFAATPAGCRAARRDASRPDVSFVTVGFRVVMEETAMGDG